MSERRFDWDSAEVHDGRLSVDLDERPDAAWVECFETAARLLGRGSYEKVAVKKGEVRLRPVTAGEEDRVRHFLEAVALEANSRVAAGSDDAGADAGGDASEVEGDGAAQEDDADRADREMTERFRAFGGSDAEA